MGWDVAIVGELVFPSAEAARAWRGADVDPPPTLPATFVRGDPVGSVDDVLVPLSERRLDWVTATADGARVSLAGLLTGDGFVDLGEALVAAVRAASRHGARGEVRWVGLGRPFAFRHDVATGALERGGADVDTAAVVRESARRARLPPEPPVRPARELHDLGRAGSPAEMIALLRRTPVADFWKEVALLDEQLPRLHERLGPEVLPVVLAIVERRSWFTGAAVLGTWFALASPPATALLVEHLAVRLMAPEVAVWLLDHPDLALPALREVAAWPDGARSRFESRRIGPIAPMNELARRLLAELVDPPSAPLPGAPKGQVRSPDWFHPALYARPRLADGTVLSAAAASRLLAATRAPHGLDPAAFDRPSLDAFLVEVFETWCAAGAPRAGRHLVDALRTLGGPEAGRGLSALAERPTVAGRRAAEVLAEGGPAR